MPGSPLSQFTKRLITGDTMHKSRLHTYLGDRIDLAGVAYLPRALWLVVLLKLFKHRQPIPWLGYRAVQALDRLIQPDWNILEFGSGMSTLFFARRARHLVSIESEPDWHRQMSQTLEQQGLTNVDYRLRDIATYVHHSDLPDASFDLVIVDGLLRDQTAEVASR